MKIGIHESDLGTPAKSSLRRRFLEIEIISHFARINDSAAVELPIEETRI